MPCMQGTRSHLSAWHGSDRRSCAVCAPCSHARSTVAGQPGCHQEWDHAFGDSEIRASQSFGCGCQELSGSGETAQEAGVDQVRGSGQQRRTRGPQLLSDA
eukprot:31642-Eustigmatos_ZCMA.PRE.1